LSTLNNYYGGQLLLVKSLFATAQSAGLVTAAIGKSGSAYIQDLGKGGYFLDENTVKPRSLATELQSNGFALPANIVKDYGGADAVTLAANNGNPTQGAKRVKRTKRTKRAERVPPGTAPADSASGITLGLTVTCQISHQVREVLADELLFVRTSLGAQRHRIGREGLAALALDLCHPERHILAVHGTFLLPRAGTIDALVEAETNGSDFAGSSAVSDGGDCVLAGALTGQA
jgi:hypothetical protein